MGFDSPRVHQGPDYDARGVHRGSQRAQAEGAQCFSDPDGSRADGLQTSAIVALLILFLAQQGVETSISQGALPQHPCSRIQCMPHRYAPTSREVCMMGTDSLTLVYSS